MPSESINFSYSSLLGSCSSPSAPRRCAVGQLAATGVVQVVPLAEAAAERQFTVLHDEVRRAAAVLHAGQANGGIAVHLLGRSNGLACAVLFDFQRGQPGSVRVLVGWAARCRRVPWQSICMPVSSRVREVGRSATAAAGAAAPLPGQWMRGRRRCSRLGAAAGSKHQGQHGATGDRRMRCSLGESHDRPQAVAQGSDRFVLTLDQLPARLLGKGVDLLVAGIGVRICTCTWPSGRRVTCISRPCRCSVAGSGITGHSTWQAAPSPPPCVAPARLRRRCGCPAADRQWTFPAARSRCRNA